MVVRPARSWSLIAACRAGPAWSASTISSGMGIPLKVSGLLATPAPSAAALAGAAGVAPTPPVRGSPSANSAVSRQERSTTAEASSGDAASVTRSLVVGRASPPTGRALLGCCLGNSAVTRELETPWPGVGDPACNLSGGGVASSDGIVMSSEKVFSVLVASGAGRLCRPRTIAGEFGNPSRVPISAACRSSLARG